MSSHPLDNPVWHSLGGPHAGLRLDYGGIRRYRPDVSLFAAVEAPGAGAAESLAAAIPEGGVAALVTPAPVDIPAHLAARRISPVLQMVATSVHPEGPAAAATELSDAHVPQMLELVELTQPGPFQRRTIEMGRYIGVIEDGRLVAMAGERMRLSGFTEISAVCTHPDHRGRGHARRLVSALWGGIAARGETPFLHVTPDNRTAISTYEGLGFAGRHIMTFTVFGRP